MQRRTLVSVALMMITCLPMVGRLFFQIKPIPPLLLPDKMIFKQPKKWQAACHFFFRMPLFLFYPTTLEL